MAVGDLFKYAHRALFAKPSPERQLLKLVKGHPIRRVVEVGVDSIDTTTQLLAALRKQAAGESIQYTAIDAFDERATGEPPLPLRQVYRTLISTEAQTRLVPGRLGPAVAAEANSLGDTDLLLLCSAATDEALAEAWFYVPRMCHPGTLVLRRLESDLAESQEDWTAVSMDQVAALAHRDSSRRLAA